MADGHSPGQEEEEIAAMCQACGGGRVDLSVSCSGLDMGFCGGCGRVLGHLVAVERFWGT